LSFHGKCAIKKAADRGSTVMSDRPTTSDDEPKAEGHNADRRDPEGDKRRRELEEAQEIIDSLRREHFWGP
jgi:hypothetical protein